MPVVQATLLPGTSLTADADGNKVLEIRYKAWGEIRATWTSSPSTTPTYKMPLYQYTGQASYMDDPLTSGVTEGFGLMFYNARWYDPYLNHFVQADTIIPGGVQGLDRYGYVSNNPIKLSDPSGHKCVGDAEECLNSDGKKEAGFTGGDTHPQNREGCGKYYQSTCGGGVSPLRKTGAGVLSVFATVLDLFSLGIGIGGVFFEVAYTAAGAAGGGALGAGIGLAKGIAYYNMNLNPAENLLGWASFGLTAASDALAGNTNLQFNQNTHSIDVTIGQDTLVSGVFAYTGSNDRIGEAIQDTGQNAIAVVYDIGRLANIIPTVYNLSFSISIPKW